jgi:hypothetical protein
MAPSGISLFAAAPLCKRISARRRSRAASGAGVNEWRNRRAGRSARTRFEPEASKSYRETPQNAAKRRSRAPWSHRKGTVRCMQNGARKTARLFCIVPARIPARRRTADFARGNAHRNTVVPAHANASRNAQIRSADRCVLAHAAAPFRRRARVEIRRRARGVSASVRARFSVAGFERANARKPRPIRVLSRGLIRCLFWEPEASRGDIVLGFLFPALSVKMHHVICRIMYIMENNV